eukprot:TRINITY_DN2622_c0_g1_i1.p1 TRINITY_DN2622_c0_g1~~TRINITY_DN2622_c0_g1_i1.p1  ORF type:complete len:245 (-),score=35.73 TRINITY_DN2622_c0_g1_i1:17-751(-)
MTDAESDLQGFFTNTDYTEETLNFGHYRLRCRQLATSCTDFDLTGQIPWPGAMVLCQFIICPQYRTLFAAKSCVELGAGTGRCGLLAGFTASSVVLTDNNEIILDLLRQNVELNASAFQHMKTLPGVVNLNWGSSIAGVREFPSDGFDVVLAADVVYSPDYIEALFKTADDLLSKAPGAIFVLSYVNRWENVNRALQTALQRSAVFDYQSIPAKSFLGELTVSIYEETIYLMSRKSLPPSAANP